MAFNLQLTVFLAHPLCRRSSSLVRPILLTMISNSQSVSQGPAFFVLIGRSVGFHAVVYEYIYLLILEKTHLGVG